MNFVFVRARIYLNPGLARAEVDAQEPFIREARALRAQVLATITATDFSRLDQAPEVQASGVQALSEAQSGFSANFLAT